MPTAATTGQQAAAPTHNGASAPTVLVPFTRAAKEHTEVFVDVTDQMDGNTRSLGPFDVAAYGYMRGIRLLIEATGGAGGAANVAAHEDAPWSAISEVVLMDVNGAPLVGPLSGYDLYLINKWGGYAPKSADPKQSPAFSAVASGAGATGNFAFILDIPVEVSGRDGLGSLANLNSASAYKLRVTRASSTDVYTVAPATTLPSVRVRATLLAWTQPTPADQRGNQNAVQPPAHGTTSYWSKTVANLAGGQQTVRLPRVGNLIRELIFVYRDTNGSRSAGAGLFPDPASIYWDTRLTRALIRSVWRDDMRRKTDFTAAADVARGLDNGVFVEDYAHDFDGSIGWELRDGWLATSQSTRLELQGQFGGAGVLTILTNDVAAAGEVYV